MESVKPTEPTMVDWTKTELPPITFSNAFMVQYTEHEFILHFGTASFPIFLTPPTPEQAAEVRTVPAHAICRLGIPPGRVVELFQMLQQCLQAYQQSHSQ
jgi:hypothetical protein